MAITPPPFATLDGRRVDVQPGDTIQDAAARLGVPIPTLCHVPGLPPAASCRLCTVEVDGRWVGACHTPLTPGASVRTVTDGLVTLRRGILELYQASHPAAGQQGAFRALLIAHGLTPPAKTPGRHAGGVPYLRFDADQCVVCRACVQACTHRQGQFVLGVTDRGGDTRLTIGRDDTFASSDCVSCGACVDACPTGALSDRDRVGPAGLGLAAESVTDTVCGYCGVGCRLQVSQAGGRVLRIQGVPDAAVNRGHLCGKGRYAHAWHRSPERLTQPLVRRDGALVPATWPEAIARAAEGLTALAAAHGPDAIGVFTSSRSTNESAYLLQKLFREQLGTNNVDCCARVCHASTALGLRLVTGAGAASASFDDIERATRIVVAGANPTEAHPVVGARIKQAVMNGAQLVVIDPRRIELADFAAVHLALTPGTNVALFNAVAQALLARGAVDDAYLAERVEGLAAFTAHVGQTSVAAAAVQCGVPAADIEAFVEVLAGGPTLFVHGLGLSELFQGTASVMTLAALGLLTGSVGRPGAGMLPLRGQNNVQGNADMGGMPNLVTGYQGLSDPVTLARLQPHWRRPPPPTPGLTLPEMIDAAVTGEVRGLWIQGEAIVQSDPNEAHVIQALDRLDLLIVQELFMTETARRADVVFPAAGALEQDGTFTNGERRVQALRAAVPPPGAARPDWAVVQAVAQALGASWRYGSPAAVLAEVAAVAPHLYGGVHADRLGGDGLQWPCPTADHPGTATVHADGFLRGKAALMCVDFALSAEHGVPGYPLLLITGRVLHHYNVGTMTRRTPHAELVDRDVLGVHPADAVALGLVTGGRALIESQWGAVEAPVLADPRIAQGTAFLSFHFPETHTNRLTGPVRDPQANCPQYKATAVRVRPIP